MPDSYYDVLGVDPDASDQEIKRAFQETIKTVHPDHNDDPDAGEQFRRVREARDTLLDPKARQRYDRRRQRERQDQDEQDDQDDEATETDSTSSHEWAREQQRQQRKQQQRQQANERRKRQQRQQNQRHQRKQHRQRTQDRQHRTQARADWTSNERSRTSRHTRTRTQERDEPSNQERAWRTTDQSVEERLRARGAWLRNRIPHPRQWLWTHFHSSAATQQFFIKIATSPTTLRLSAAIGLMIVLTMIARAADLSPATSPTLGLLIVLGCLVASYAGYAVATPLPFEESRTQSRFKPAGRIAVWPAVVLNGTGLGLLGLAVLAGAPFAGIGFTVFASVYVGVLLISLSIGFTIALKLIGVSQTVKYGVVCTLIATPVIMFTRYSGETLRTIIRENAGAPMATPWIPPLMIGPVYLGSFANFVIAMVCFGCFFGSVILMCWSLAIVPWHDHYDHGYQLHPTVWNLALAAPVTVLAWMFLTGVPAVSIGSVIFRQATLWIGLFVLPTILGSAYLLRRQLEPYIRE